MRMAALLPLILLTAAAVPDDSRSYMVTGFDRVRVDGPFQVEIVPGSNGASAEGDPAALDRLSVRVSGSTLIVNSGTAGFQRRMGDAPEATRIRISAPSLRGLTSNGGARIHVAEMRAARIEIGLQGNGAIDIAGIRADNLTATHFGMGLLKLGGTARQVRVQGALSGTVDATGLVADDANLLWQSTGALTIGVRYTAQISGPGPGPIAILGKPLCTIRTPAPVTCEGTIERR